MLVLTNHNFTKSLNFVNKFKQIDVHNFVETSIRANIIPN